MDKAKRKIVSALDGLRNLQSSAKAELDVKEVLTPSDFCLTKVWRVRACDESDEIYRLNCRWFATASHTTRAASRSTPSSICWPSERPTDRYECTWGCGSTVALSDWRALQTG